LTDIHHQGQRVLRIVPADASAMVDDANLLAPAEQQLAATHRHLTAALAKSLQANLAPLRRRG
jgi:hypothetical protein